MKDKVHELDSFLLWIGGGSFTAYGILHDVSEFCKLVMPILSVISFAIYIIINWKKIKGFFKKKK